MEENKILVNDTANFYLYNKEGEKIVSLEETQGVSVEKENGKTYIRVLNALFDTDMLSILGDLVQQDKATDFEKDIGIKPEKKSVVIRSDVDEDAILSGVSYKVLLQTISYNPDTMAINKQIDMAFPEVKYTHSDDIHFVNGDATRPQYKFEVVGDYSMSVTSTPSGYKIK